MGATSLGCACEGAAKVFAVYYWAVLPIGVDGLNKFELGIPAVKGF
jgi:hypothetical protein